MSELSFTAAGEIDVKQACIETSDVRACYKRSSHPSLSLYYISRRECEFFVCQPMCLRLKLMSVVRCYCITLAPIGQS